ncbi:phosphomannomutase/phosphoglucomutase [Patescibacteria group bacterium]
MDIPRHIFKAYDIRGLVDQEITPDLAQQIGKAFAKLLKAELPDKDLVVAVGRDMRESSPVYQEKLIKGLTESGIKVKDIGLVSTPAFYFGVSHTQADGGVMVSASHNPAEYNGFKLTRARAVPVSGDTGIQTLADLIEAEDYLESDQMGEVETVEGIPELAVVFEMEFAGSDPISNFKIVADSSNGMGAQYLDLFFEKVEADLTRMYWELDGTFPNHEADPLKEENIEDLKAKVKETGADLGIITDGDGDRIFFVDDQGEVMPPHILRGLIAQIVLRSYPGATIGYDIRPGQITEDMIVEAGGKPVVTRVGHSLIKEKMMETDAIFGGESSGHFFFKFPTGVYEGPVTVTTMLLQELTRQNISLSALVAPLKRYFHSGEVNFEVQDKTAAMESLKEKYSEGELIDIDGITIKYPDFWFNVRPSNTESLLRLNLEAKTQEIMEQKRDEISQFIQSQ